MIIANGEGVSGDRLLNLTALVPGELEEVLLKQIPVTASAEEQELRNRLLKTKLKEQVDGSAARLAYRDRLAAHVRDLLGE